MQKPVQYAPKVAKTFQELSVVEAYRHRPPYPEETFDILVSLIRSTPRRVLDVGCGTGEIARPLAKRVDQVDALDASKAMIEAGKKQPDGNNPNLRWVHSQMEDANLEPSYSLITAGGSLHWLDWDVVFPYFRKILLPDSYLAIISSDTKPGPWLVLSELTDDKYRTDNGFQPYNLLEELVKHGSFRKVGEQKTKPVRFLQSINDFVESFHSRSMFVKEQMGAKRVAEFREAAEQILRRSYSSGMMEFKLEVTVVWGQLENFAD
jgi:ubiquinone/menaquinone biosynthesis C-methylase UbiE